MKHYNVTESMIKREYGPEPSDPAEYLLGITIVPPLRDIAAKGLATFLTESKFCKVENAQVTKNDETATVIMVDAAKASIIGQVHDFLEPSRHRKEDHSRWDGPDPYSRDIAHPSKEDTSLLRFLG